MLVKYFRQNQPAILLLLLPLVLLLWPGAGAHVAAPVDAVPSGMPLFIVLRAMFTSLPWTLPVLGIVLVIGLSMQVTFTANESDLFERRNHLPALLLPLLLAFFPQGLMPHPALAGMPFVLWAMRRFWASQGQQRVLGPLFDAGSLIGFAALFHLPYVFLVVVLWASLAVMRPFHWREYALPVMGMAVVLFLAWGILHLFRPSLWDLAGSMHVLRTEAAALHSPHWLYGILLLLLALVFLVSGIAAFARGYARGIMRDKNTRASFLAFTFACGLLCAFSWFIEGRAPAVLVAVPLAIFLAWPLLQAKRIAWAESGVLCLMALAIWAKWS